MALQSATGYVRKSISTGFDEKSITVNWMTFNTIDWRESNPSQVWKGVEMQGSHTFDLSIKETQINHNTDESEEVTIGYMPQTRDQAELLLKDLNVKGASFALVNLTIEGEIKKDIVPIWGPDIKIATGQKYRFYSGTWNDYESLTDHFSDVNFTPDKSINLWKSLKTTTLK